LAVTAVAETVVAAKVAAAVLGANTPVGEEMELEEAAMAMGVATEAKEDPKVGRDNQVHEAEATDLVAVTWAVAERGAAEKGLEAVAAAAAAVATRWVAVEAAVVVTVVVALGAVKATEEATTVASLAVATDAVGSRRQGR
jgi:hypothetical protein